MTAHLDHLGSPSSLQRSSLFQFFHWLWGWVHFQVEDGEGGERKKKKKTQETENREDRDKRNNAKAKTGFFLKKMHVLFSRQIISSFHLLEVSSVCSHFIDEETEYNKVLLKV